MLAGGEEIWKVEAVEERIVWLTLTESWVCARLNHNGEAWKKVSNFYVVHILQSFFGINFGGGGEIDIILEDADNRKVIWSSHLSTPHPRDF